MNIVKVKKVTSDHAMILTNGGINRTLTFVTDALPQNAVIDTIKVEGKFLEDIGCGKVIEYHRQRANTAEGWKDIATVSYLSDDNFYEEETNNFLDRVHANIINSFEVYYHEEAIVEV